MKRARQWSRYVVAVVPPYNRLAQIQGGDMVKQFTEGGVEKG